MSVGIVQAGRLPIFAVTVVKYVGQLDPRIDAARFKEAIQGGLGEIPHKLGTRGNWHHLYEFWIRVYHHGKSENMLILEPVAVRRNVGHRLSEAVIYPAI